VTRIAVLGYVNLDHVVGLTRDITPGLTSLVRRRHTPPEGRLGGCASYIATGLASRGAAVSVVSYTGDDPAATVVERAFASAGVDTTGLEGSLDATGVSWLPYAPSGASYCVYDPGGQLPVELTPAQRRVCAEADWLVAAVGAPAPCLEALAVLPASSSAVWSVKGDPGSFPPALARELAGRASVIVHSSDEAGFLAEQLGDDWRTHTVRPGALVVETHGADGVRFWTDGAERWVRLDEPLRVYDTIGAGDRFCAGLLAAVLDGEEPEAAVLAGVTSAQALLRDRAEHPDDHHDERRTADANAGVVPARDA
jgi:sugar/nucleoside kinase (ribokinase family)